MTNWLIGIDPGLNGAFVFHEPTRNLFAVHDMPTLKVKRGASVKNELNLPEVARLIDAHGEPFRHAFIEQVGSMPGQGVSSSFAFGKSYGAMLGILAAHFIPVTYVPPGRWKRHFGLSAEKDLSRAKAIQMLPHLSGLFSRKKDADRAEAVLISIYGAQTMQKLVAAE